MAGGSHRYETAPFLTYLAEVGGSHLHPGDDDATSALLRALAPQPKTRILEVGCGTGITLARVLHHVDLHMEGVDGSRSMLQLASRRLRACGLASRVTLTCACLEDVGWPAHSFHGAYAESVLGFQEEPVIRSCLRALFRALKPAGLLVLNDAIWKPDLDHAQIARVVQSSRADFGLPPATASGWDLARWELELSGAGFERVCSERLADLPPSSVPHLPEPAASRRFTRRRMLPSRLTPRLIIQRRQYHKKLEIHRTNWRFLESRLFVVRKPTGPTPSLG